ncbi:MAG: 16S rRNA (cytosine(1402)-N(4))-methyltransferase [Candidatus Magasanikbacteria bacterium RIFOXYC2_FULL_42_28]|uniref:Ribosomal RNA small subunit methyltransferase H n=1 Tax=Candidatus Magasanikbacteria bacterium RIFOXYC2_FULL_42_28 TaxID=1798704 RepID=A0A1F6NX17_9BACT|nr:MAG: 16S rRNA (cytosine(1402)-N(4))-methyltransferase [Candidatus Magasanikbacteria bacterium RIFOXYC2_FULL_42_28]
MRHIPVLLNEVLESLNLKNGSKVIDCTVGDAGHSEVILEKIGPKGKLLAIDTDSESLLRAKRNLYRFGERVIFSRGNFRNLEKIVLENKFDKADAILMDLGWSTPQFEERGRGFSFKTDEPLDMRFDPSADTPTAGQLVNRLPEDELNGIFKRFGEEELSEQIAGAIVEARKIKLIARSSELSEIVLQVYRQKLKSTKEIPWVGGLHPATKIFQALRIAVNEELEVLKEVLPIAVKLLAPSGRLAVISFHSLEDRIVKQYFQKIENKEIYLINKKPIIATEAEVAENASARSAKLRVVEKI